MVDEILGIAKNIAKASFGDVHISDFNIRADKLADQAVRKKTGSALQEVMEAGISGIKDKKQAAEAAEKVQKAVKGFRTGAISDIEDALTQGLEGIDTSSNKKYQKLLSQYQKEGEGIFDKFTNAYNGSEESARAFLGREGKNGIGLANTIGAYLGDAEYGSMRKKVIAAGVVGTGVGMRYLQGGTLTQRPNGENDIAGIPFF